MGVRHYPYFPTTVPDLLFQAFWIPLLAALSTGRTAFRAARQPLPPSLGAKLGKLFSNCLWLPSRSLGCYGLHHVQVGVSESLFRARVAFSPVGHSWLPILGTGPWLFREAREAGLARV